MLQKKSLAIYVDFQNVRLTSQLAELLISFASKLGDLRSKKVYADWQIETKESAQDLHDLAFECLNVPSNKRNNVDKKMMDDCEREIAELIILVTSDGDFTNLVKSLKLKAKKMIVFYKSDIVNKKLIQGADLAYPIEKLPKLAENPTQILDALYWISYKDATKCLIETIKAAVKQGKRTTFSFIANQMRMNQQFPNYGGVSSIRKPDGTTFSTFSKFVEAVKAEGKVQVRTVGKLKELLLIEKDIQMA